MDSLPSSRITTVGSCLEKPETLMLNFLASWGNLVTLTCRKRSWGVV